MLYYAVVSLVVGLIAGAINLAGGEAIWSQGGALRLSRVAADHIQRDIPTTQSHARSSAMKSSSV